MMFPTIVINREDPASMDAQTLLDELSATLAVFTGDSTVINRGIGADITFWLRTRLDDVTKR